MSLGLESTASSTSRNEAEFTIWCLKTLMFAKCLSNPSHLPIELESYDFFHSKSSRELKKKKVSLLHLSSAVQTKTQTPVDPSPHTVLNPWIGRSTGPISGRLEKFVWWRASTYMCLSLFDCLRRCCVSSQIDLSCHWWDYLFHQKKILKCQWREGRECVALALKCCEAIKLTRKSRMKYGFNFLCCVWDDNVSVVNCRVCVCVPNFKILEVVICFSPQFVF